MVQKTIGDDDECTMVTRYTTWSVPRTGPEPLGFFTLSLNDL